MTEVDWRRRDGQVTPRGCPAGASRAQPCKARRARRGCVREVSYAEREVSYAEREVSYAEREVSYAGREVSGAEREVSGAERG
jgi:hypothetical protein